MYFYININLDYYCVFIIIMFALQVEVLNDPHSWENIQPLRPDFVDNTAFGKAHKILAWFDFSLASLTVRLGSGSNSLEEL